MDVKITTFRNPYSFFCIAEDLANINNNNLKNIVLSEDNEGALSNKFDLTGVSHGQYIAVLWKDHWVRGIISLENQCLIWLVDYGIYLRANDKTVYVNLAAEDKKYPTKVFEASIHGCIPLEKVIDDECDIKNVPSTTWNNGAVNKAQGMIAQADKIYFVPVAMMSTKVNDVVIGNLYLQLKGRGIVNLIDELLEWPVFLKKDPQLYIENLSIFYKSRRQHRASLKRPIMPSNLPTVNPELTLSDYTAICAKAIEQNPLESPHSDEEGSTCTYIDRVSPPSVPFKPTAEEIEKYSNIYITISGVEYNVLNVVLNKTRDLRMCELYADQKYIGRATSRSSNLHNRFQK